jgi:hypothetical protein
MRQRVVHKLMQHIILNLLQNDLSFLPCYKSPLRLGRDFAIWSCIESSETLGLDLPMCEVLRGCRGDEPWTQSEWKAGSWRGEAREEEREPGLRTALKGVGHDTATTQCRRRCGDEVASSRFSWSSAPARNSRPLLGTRASVPF